MYLLCRSFLHFSKTRGGQLPVSVCPCARLFLSIMCDRRRTDKLTEVVTYVFLWLHPIAVNNVQYIMAGLCTRHVEHNDEQRWSQTENSTNFGWLSFSFIIISFICSRFVNTQRIRETKKKELMSCYTKQP